MVIRGHVWLTFSRPKIPNKLWFSSPTTWHSSTKTGKRLNHWPNQCSVYNSNVKTLKNRKWKYRWGAPVQMAGLARYRTRTTLFRIRSVLNSLFIEILIYLDNILNRVNYHIKQTLVYLSCAHTLAAFLKLSLIHQKPGCTSKVYFF